MQNEQNLTPGEMLRRAMRHWVTGVAIAASQYESMAHGMTVNSFVSISLAPPLVTVVMNNDTRTCHLVQQSGVFAVTILSEPQQALADLFAGRLEDHGDRMIGVETFSLITGAPLFRGGLAFIDCRVVSQHPLPLATLFIAEVVAAQTAADRLTIDRLEANSPAVADDQMALDTGPLVYYNRAFTQLKE